MDTEIDEALRERLKSALWFSIGKIVDEECLALNVNATPQFIGALTEMVWVQLENVTRDLESFAKHAGRSTINTDDVLLLARRNEGLGDLLKEFVEKEKAEKSRSGSIVKGKESTAKGKGSIVKRDGGIVKRDRGIVKRKGRTKKIETIDV